MTVKAISGTDSRENDRQMTSATDEMRRMLDERGVEWRGGLPTETMVEADELDLLYVALPDGRVRAFIRNHLTPEQAIAATLGRGVCTMSVIDTGNEAAYEHYEYIMHCESCHNEFGLVQYNEDGDTWQDEQPDYCPWCGRRVVDE